MKKLIVALLLLASGAFARPAINVLEYGPPTAGTITNVLDRIGAAEVALVIKGGRWNVGTNFTTPTNVFLEMEPGAYFYIQTTNVLTINGNMDNNWALKFTGPGAGLVGGTYLSKVRIPQWWGTNGTVTYGNTALGTGSGNTPHFISTTNMTNIVIQYKNDADGMTNYVENGTNFLLKVPQRLFWVGKNGNQVVGNTNTHITFSNAFYNCGLGYITNEGRYVNLYTGAYQFAASLCISGGTAVAVHLAITSNWVPFVSHVDAAEMDGSGRESQPVVLSPIVFFDSTGVSIRVNAKIESGGSCFQSNGTYFSGMFLGN